MKRRGAFIFVLLALAGCPKKQETAPSVDAGGPAIATLDASSVGPPETPRLSAGWKPSPLSSAPPLPAPSAITSTGLDAGVPGVRVIYAQANDGGDDVSIAGVDRKSKKALLRIKRNNSEASWQLVTIDLEKGAIADTWSPSHALQATLRITNPLGPPLADALDAGASLRADLAGYASRLASFPPWADDLLSTAPGAKHITFMSAYSTWATGPDGTSPRDIGPADGHARLSPDGDKAAWAGTKLVVADLAANARAIAIDLPRPSSITWSNDSKTIYVTSGECMHAVDAATHASKQLACIKGHHERDIALAPNGRSAVVFAHTADPSKLYTDLAFVSLPDGAVKKELRVAVEMKTAALDDDGLFFGPGYNHGYFLVAVDLPNGTPKLVKEGRSFFVLGGFVDKRTVVGLRNVSDQHRVELDRISVDALEK